MYTLTLDKSSRSSAVSHRTPVSTVHRDSRWPLSPWTATILRAGLSVRRQILVKGWKHTQRQDPFQRLDASVHVFRPRLQLPIFQRHLTYGSIVNAFFFSGQYRIQYGYSLRWCINYFKAKVSQNYRGRKAGTYSYGSAADRAWNVKSHVVSTISVPWGLYIGDLTHFSSLITWVFTVISHKDCRGQVWNVALDSREKLWMTIEGCLLLILVGC